MATHGEAGGHVRAPRPACHCAWGMGSLLWETLALPPAAFFSLPLDRRLLLCAPPARGSALLHGLVASSPPAPPPCFPCPCIFFCFLVLTSRVWTQTAVAAASITFFTECVWQRRCASPGMRSATYLIMTPTPVPTVRSAGQQCQAVNVQRPASPCRCLGRHKGAVARPNQQISTL